MNSTEKSSPLNKPSGETESTVDNDQRAIDFLRQEHQAMLTGLYQEIERLQNQCADMQRRLIFHGILPSNEEALKERLSELDSKLAEKLQESEGLQADLEEKTKAIESLEEQLRQQEERYREDVSARNLIVARLRKEVQEKANAMSRVIALLGTKSLASELPADALLPAVRDALPFSASKAPTGNLYRRLMNYGPASNQNMPSTQQPMLQTTGLTISKQIMDRYCRASSGQQNVNSTSTRTFHGDPASLQCLPRVQLKRDSITAVDCMNNLQSWPAQMLNGKETSHV